MKNLHFGTRLYKQTCGVFQKGVLAVVEYFLTARRRLSNSFLYNLLCLSVNSVVNREATGKRFT